MLFNSYIFWVFFAAVFVLYRLLKHRDQNVLLLIASYVFYGWWDWRFLSLILLSTVIDYFAGRGIAASDDPRRRKLLVTLSAIANLGFLGVFKYFNFFAGELTDALGAFGIEPGFATLNVVLPVGISFYTFQTMSYTIDVYRGDTKATSNFLDFALFVSFFPQLVAGPIERSSRLLPQVQNARRVTSDDYSAGLYLVAMGLFKKMFIADNMAPIVNTVFATPTADLSGAEVLMGVYAFAFQIYGDFAGYSDVARGVSRWLGFDLMVNFRMPYFARTPSEFWRRWHISLSTWLRDYLYIPLGGNRGGKWKTHRNLMLTMLLGGLWHGAGWTFVAWGALHGLLLIGYRVFSGSSNETSRRSSPWRSIAAAVLMFHLVCAAWLLFRAESMSQVFGMTRQLLLNFHMTDFAIYMAAMIAFHCLPLILYELWVERGGDLMRLVSRPWPVRAAVYVYVLLMAWCFPPRGQYAFIYFQF